MAGIGRDLVVNLAGNNSKLKSAIADSKGGLKSFAASATSLLNPITAGFAAVAGGALAAGAAVYGFTSRLATLAGVADQAIQTGLDGAFLQRLGYAADQSGVSVETLTGGIKRLTMAIGKGDEKPFAALGLSLRELQQLTPEAQFREVAAKIAQIPTAAGRAAAAVKIFGKSGIEMTGLFAGGLNDLNALLKDAENLGIGVSDEGLAKAAAADDAIQRMKASFGALLDQITVGLAPAFEYVAKTLADLSPPVTLLLSQFNSLGDKGKFLGEVIDAGMSVAFEGIKENWDEMLGDMILAAADAGQKIARYMDPAAAVGGAIGGMVGKTLAGPETAPGQSKLDAAQQKLASVMSQLTNQPKPFVPQGPKVPIKDDGSKLKGLFTGIVDAAKPIAEAAKSKLGQAFGAAKVDANFWTDVGKKAIGVDGDKIKALKTDKLEEKPEEKQKEEMRFAGAMQKGSAEAYSTIIASMFGNKDPNVKATEKQTKEIVKAIKGQKGSPMNLVAEFAV